MVACDCSHAPAAAAAAAANSAQVGNRWATKRELELESLEQAEVTARELLENSHRAENEKLAGNQVGPGAGG